MKSFHSVLALAALLLAPLAQAQVVVTVDDKPSDDAAYVNGTGGNFSGDTALKNAIDAVNADNSGAASFEIKIIDTDGTADTYNVAANVTAANLTIHQVPNGGGNDAAATIQAVDTAGAGATLAFFGTGSKLAGLSAAKPLNIKTAGTGAPSIITGTVGPITMTFENLSYINSANDALDHNDFGGDANKHEGNQTFNNCTFRTYDGPQTAFNTTYNDCRFESPHHKLVQFTGDNVINRGYFSTAGDSAFHLGGTVAIPKTLTLNDCEFATNQRLISHAIGDGDVVTFNRPKFSSNIGDMMFEWDVNATAIINGTPTQKVNLDNADCVNLFARIWAGKLVLNDCILTKRPAVCTFGSLWGGNLKGDVTWEFNRCLFGGDAGDVISGDAPGDKEPATVPYKVTVKATNTIWYGNSGLGHIISTSGSHTGDDALDFTHCTFVRNTANAFFFGNASPKLYLEGCIVYNNKITDSHLLSAVGYVAKTPHIPSITYVYCADDGKGKVFHGNPFNPADPFAPAHEGDLVVWPGIDMTNGKGVIPANSSACGAATGSTVTDDINGNARPLPAGTAPDIGAVEVLNVPVELSTFAAE